MTTSNYSISPRWGYRNSDQAIERRRNSAEERKLSYLDPKDQLARLDQTFGPGLGAVKERRKLAFKLAKEHVMAKHGNTLKKLAD